MDIEIYRKFFGSIAKPQRSGKVFSNCESVPPIDGDTVTNRYPMQSGHEAMTVATTDGQSEQSKPEQNLVPAGREGLDEMSTPESTSFKLTEVEDKPATAHSETLTDGNTFTRN